MITHLRAFFLALLFFASWIIPSNALCQTILKFSHGDFAVEASKHNKEVQLLITVPNATSVAVSEISHPARIVLDFATTSISLTRTINAGENPFLKSVRVGSHPDKLRVVIDAVAEESPPYSMKQERKNGKTVVTLDLGKGGDVFTGQVSKNNGGSHPSPSRTPLISPSPIQRSPSTTVRKTTTTTSTTLAKKTTTSTTHSKSTTSTIRKTTTTIKPTTTTTKSKPTTSSTLRRPTTTTVHATTSTTKAKTTTSTTRPVTTSIQKTTTTRVKLTTTTRADPTPTTTMVEPTTTTSSSSTTSSTLQPTKPLPTPSIAASTTPPPQESKGGSGSAVTKILFSYLEPDHSPALEIKVSVSPEYKLVRKSDHEFLLTVQNCKITPGPLTLPLFPPQDFEGFTYVLAAAKGATTELTIGVERNERLAAFAKEGSLWVKASPPVLR